MNYYFLANIRINNPKEYQLYLDKADAIFDKYNGEYLAVDESPAVLEGRWNYTKSVIIKFKNRHDFDEWYHSDEYQEILKFRLSASDCDSILIKGIE
jgi:uncharacterized protein (DUF1330 family)